MFAVDTQPHLRVIHPEQTIEEVSLGFTVESGALSNQDKLKQLEQERDRLQTLALIAGFVGTGALALFTPSLILTPPSFNAILGRLQTISQRYNLMYQVVKEFGEEPQIEIGLKPEEAPQIDFFLKFPDKEYVLILIRSLGDVKVTFSEQHQALRFRKKGGGVKTWKPDPLGELLEQERWLRRQRPDLLGPSSRDRRRPIKKLLVLANVTYLGDHPAQMYENRNSRNYLTITTIGSSTIVEKDQVADFIRDYLADRRSKRALND